MAKRKSQTNHDVMVKQIKDKICNEGFIGVKADLQNESKPDEINGSIPDVTGKKLPWFYIYEVETEDSISDTHTEDQWKAFAKYAKEKNEKFIVVVPKGYKQKAQDRLVELGIIAQEIIEI